MTDNKPPFTKCLLHEARRAYWFALDVLATVLLLFGLAIIVTILAAWNESLRLAIWSRIAPGINTTWAYLASVPAWIYLLVAIALLPTAYAALVCVWRRVENKSQAEGILGMILFILGLCLLFSAALGGVAILSVVGFVLLVFGVIFIVK